MNKRLIKIAKRLYKNRNADILSFGDSIVTVPAAKVRHRFNGLSFGSLLLPPEYNFGGRDLYGGAYVDVYLRDQTPAIAWVRGFKWHYGDDSKAYCLELHINYKPASVSEIISCSFTKETAVPSLVMTAYNFDFAETGYEGEYVGGKSLTPSQVEELADFLEGILK